MKWFGPAPFSHASHDPEVARVPVPIALCTVCDRPFTEDDCGYLIPGIDGGLFPREFPYHVACFLSQIIPTPPVPQ